MNFSTKTPLGQAILFSFLISAGLAPLPSATAQEAAVHWIWRRSLLRRNGASRMFSRYRYRCRF